jgi:hypothetical protein
MNKIPFIIAAVLIFVALVLILNMDRINNKVRQNKLRNRILEKNGLVDELKRVLFLTLEQHHMSKRVFLVLMLCSFGVGYILGKVIYTNTFLALTMGVATSFLPFVYLTITTEKQEQEKTKRLESSMHSVTNGYLVEKDVKKVIKDNINNLEYTQPFKEFMTETFVNASTSTALENMKKKVENSFFRRWVDILLQSQKNHSNASMGLVIVQEMKTQRRMHERANAQMFADWRDFFILLVIVNVIPLIIRVFFHDGYIGLTSTPIGIALCILSMCSMVFAVRKALKVNKSITT